MAHKTVLITGASRGIGLAIARHLLQAPRSSQVVVTSRSAEPLEKLRAEFPEQVAVVAGDATDPAIAAKAVSTAVEKFGGLDGLVINHATLGEVKKVADSGISSWRKDYEINFFSAVEFVWLRRKVKNTELGELKYANYSDYAGESSNPPSQKVQGQDSLHLLWSSSQGIPGLGILRIVKGCYESSRHDSRPRGSRYRFSGCQTGGRRYSDAG